MSNNLSISRLLNTPIADVVTDPAQLAEITFQLAIGTNIPGRPKNPDYSFPPTVGGVLELVKRHAYADTAGTNAYIKGIRDNPVQNAAAHAALDTPPEDARHEEKALLRDVAARTSLAGVIEALQLLGGTQKLLLDEKKEAEAMVRRAPIRLGMEASDLTARAESGNEPTDYPVETAAGHRATAAALTHAAKVIDQSIIKTLPTDFGPGATPA